MDKQIRSLSIGYVLLHSDSGKARLREKRFVSDAKYWKAWSICDWYSTQCIRSPRYRRSEKEKQVSCRTTLRIVVAPPLEDINVMYTYLIHFRIISRESSLSCNFHSDFTSGQVDWRLRMTKELQYVLSSFRTPFLSYNFPSLVHSCQSRLHSPSAEVKPILPPSLVLERAPLVHSASAIL